MREPVTYTIVTMDDFLAVPEGRLADCLEEFAETIVMYRATVEIIRSVAEAEGSVLPEKFMSMPAWHWIDDGKRNQSVRFIGDTP